MTNALIETLARLVRQYFDDLRQGGVECRLVLPALTEQIAIGLQEKLVSDGLPSYLVVPRSQVTDSNRRWIRAEGVTSVRQGDMIVVVWPGEMSHIQDSVIGAGGAMRNFAFSDEWPWIETSNEYFRFDGPVLLDILKSWGVRAESQSTYLSILQATLDACRDSLMRGSVFLDAILGTFDPSAHTAIENDIEHLLFHLGIPRPERVEWSEKGAAKRYFGEVRRVLKELSTRIRDTDGKQELLTRISDIEADTTVAEALKVSFGQLVDTLTTRGDDRQEGLLALHGCWGNERAWIDWGLSQLQALLDVVPTDEDVSITYELDVNNGVVAQDGKSAVLIEGGSVHIDVNYEGLAADSTDTEIRILDRARPLFSQACVGTSGKIQIDLYYDHIFGQPATGKKKSLRIVVMRGQKELATGRVTAIPCGPNQPVVAVIEPGFKYYFGNPTNQGAASSEDVEKIDVSEPVRITVLSWDGFDDGEVEIDDEPVSLDQDPENPRIFRFPNAIDPGSSGGGFASIDLRVSGLEIAVDVEAKNITRGEFTLERELIVKLAAMSQAPGHRTAVGRIVDIFTGKQTEPYPSLGGLDDLSRNRIRWAKTFESSTNGRPIIADLLYEGNLLPEPIDSQFALAYIPILPVAFRDEAIRAEVAGLISAYAEARQATLDVVCEGVRSDSQWPHYALLPILVETKRRRLEDVILAYLNAYLAVLTYVQKNLTKLTWAELFRLSCADCVVHWDDGASARKIVLIGPWHPVVVAKRFMVQSALLGSARRHLGLKNAGKGHVLALLLDQVNSLRWFASPASDGTTFESYYVTSTSDPGWLVAMSHDTVGGPDYLSFTVALRRLHGLETGLMPSSRDQVAKGYLQDFVNAYPTRRAISVVADASYSPARLVESAQSLLYEGEGVSSVGRQLPGGIHIAVAGQHDLDAQEWREPPVCLYGISSSEMIDRQFNDIHLLSPGRAKSTRDSGDRVSLPRGHGLLAAFANPIKQVGAWADGVLNSRAFERDSPLPTVESLGDIFTQVCSQLASLPDEERVMSWQADLPPSLDHLWTVIPGNHVDPAVFVRYVTVAARRGESTALWDYSMSLTGALNSYFVLSRIPASVSHELNKSPVLENRPLAPAVLGELGRVGMALGSESLRSGSKALGVIGVVAAVRLFLPGSIARPPIRNGKCLRGFLLPVDAFREILGGSLDSAEPGQRQRADLVAIQLGLQQDGSVGISCCAIECKYSSNPFGTDQTTAALQQASATLRRIHELLEASQVNSGIPERLALLSLISFGLRLSQEQLNGDAATFADLEAKLLQGVLDGKIKIVPPRSAKIVVVTDCTAPAASWTQGQGLVITVGPKHWPEVSESPELRAVRDRLAQEFDPLFDVIGSEQGYANDPDESARDNAMESEKEGDQDKQSMPASGARITGQEIVPASTNNTATVSSVKTEDAVVPLGALQPVLLGTADGVKLFYDPQNRQTPLDNYNVMVTGSSGKGKTQLIKAIVSRLREQNRNVLLLDFKNDFASDEHFVKKARLQPQYVTFDGLPFNPLIPVPLRRPGSPKEYLSISEHINGLVDIFKKTFGLGDQQEVAVKNAIRECFEARGIQSRGTVEVRADIDYPDFNDVGDKLRDTNPNAYNRLDPLFDLGIFPPSSRLTRFDTMLNGSIVVDLSQIQSDKIKNAVAKILVMSAHRYYNAREHSGHLRQFFAFDEAHRVLDSDFLLQFVRECRAYGVGVLLSSQYPTDFPADVSASLNTKIIHGNGADRDRVRDITRLVGGLVSDEQIVQLSMFQAIVSNPQYQPTIVKTIGYPMMLVFDAIRESGGVARSELRVEGVDPARLNVAYLVYALMDMGVVVEASGVLRALS
jgi:hypothetical protein